MPWLKQRTQFDDSDCSPFVRQAAVQEIAHGWKDDPTTLSLIKQIAQFSDDLEVRETAVQELARGWKDDPETLHWLKQYAQCDKSNHVQETAVQELAWGWKYDP